MGIIFDVDGVLLRGGSVIPAARRAFRNLVDQNNNFRFPVVFVTNAGSCQRQHKAQQLSHLLDVQVGQTGGAQTGAWVETCLYYRDSSAVTSLLPSCDLSLSLQIAPEQVVLSYSPLQMFKSFHDKCVLVSGQGPVMDIANTYPSHQSMSGFVFSSS